MVQVVELLPTLVLIHVYVFPHVLQKLLPTVQAAHVKRDQAWVFLFVCFYPLTSHNVRGTFAGGKLAWNQRWK